MATISPQRALDLAKTLPVRLQTFFKRFPPGGPYATGPQRPEKPTALTSTPTATLPPSESGETSTASSTSPTAIDLLRASIVWTDATYNPFQPWKNPITGRWRPPMFGLRRQADIVKLAQKYGVEELLPHSSKLSWVKIEKREKQGLRVKGTGVGEKVKGKSWERTQKGRLEKRRVAMLGMPQMVQQWKERGHGRGWKKWPK